MYRLKAKKGERSYWYCVQPTCPARINSLHDIPTKISMNHNHENNPTGAKVISVMNSIRKRVRESTESVQAIYEDLLCSARSTEWDDTTEVVKKIPTCYSSRSALYRHRSKLHPALPNTRDEIVLDGESVASKYIYALLEIIKKEQQINEIKMLQFQNGGRQHPRKRKYRFVDSRLATLKERLESGEIDLYVYADSD